KVRDVLQQCASHEPAAKRTRVAEGSPVKVRDVLQQCAPHEPAPKRTRVAEGSPVKVRDVLSIAHLTSPPRKRLLATFQGVQCHATLLTSTARRQTRRCT